MADQNEQPWQDRNQRVEVGHPWLLDARATTLRSKKAAAVAGPHAFVKVTVPVMLVSLFD